MLQGVFTALVTPFNRDGSVDFAAFKALVKRQVDLGINGLVPIGTTGESPTLSQAEKDQLIAITAEVAAGKVPVIAGSGANCTQSAIEETRRAKDNGADHTLQVAPYYNRPSQAGLYEHFVQIAEEGDLPSIIYNVPGRSGVNISVDTLLRLAEHPLIVGVKEASGSIDQIGHLLSRAPQDFSVLSGDDAVTLPLIALGGHGIISVASNMFVEEMVQLTSAALQGNYKEALAEHNRLYPFFINEFIETNPVPIKTYMANEGLLEEVFRLPLVGLAPENKTTLLETFA